MAHLLSSPLIIFLNLFSGIIATDYLCNYFRHSLKLLLAEAALSYLMETDHDGIVISMVIKGCHFIMYVHLNL